MNRKTKLMLNAIFGFSKQIVMVVCGFILPRFILRYYGSDINGLVASITNFLGFISLLEMGIGPVVQASLYKPLADGDDAQISRVVVSAERFFRMIALIFLAYIAVLCFVYPRSVNTTYDAWFTISLLLIISISTFAQYFFGATYQLLLNADQKAFIQMGLQIVVVILNTVFSIILMKLGASIHVVRLVTAAVFILRPLGQMIYVRRHYHLDKKIVITEEPIKQKWNGFSQHLASVITQNADVVILTLFSTLTAVSVYNVYYNVVFGIATVILTATTGIESYFGNMLVKKEDAEFKHAFEVIEWAMHVAVMIVFGTTFVTITPFISVYTNGITDADYLQVTFGHMLTLAYASLCLRVPYFRMIKAAGHFKQTQNGAFISAFINIAVSIALVFRFGLVGIAFGTLAAMLYHTCYFVWYLSKNVLNRSIRYYLKYIAVDVVILALMYLIFRNPVLSSLSYLTWAVLAVKAFAAAAVITLALSFVSGPRISRDVFSKATHILKKLKGRK